MKILYFHQYFATRRSATGTRSFELARRFVARGHDVTIVSSAAQLPHHEDQSAGRVRPLVRDKLEGIDLLLLGVPYSNYFSYPLRLAAFAAFTAGASVAGVLLGSPDVVYATSPPLTIGLPGLLAARAKGVPFVFEVRDLWPEYPIAIGVLRRPSLIAAAQWLERTLYAHADRVVVLSESAVDTVAAQGVPRDKLLFAPNSSDLDLFGPDHVDHEVRAAHGLEGKFVAVYAGAMGVANGVDQLIDAMAALRDAGEHDIAAVAVGDGSERPRLEARARELGLDNLVFLPPMPKEQVAGLVGAADVALELLADYPAFETASPNKFFDGLAAGKPVVVNVGGWLRRLVEQNNAGLYVPADDPQALAAALVALAREPELSRRMGANARRLAEREFDRDEVAARLCASLEELAAHADAATPDPYGFYERLGKRLVDLTVAGVGCVVAAPLLAGLAATVYATSGRPVLFVQDRVGRDGAVFGMYKFRSMVPDATEHGAGLYVEHDDDRITWAGRWLRAFSLDELPQLLNVLKGDMSIVGPRPNVEFVVERYRDRFERVLKVKPGLTCLVAVNGRNRLRRSEMLDWDERYVATLGPLTDLKIFLRTIPTVLLRRGSSNDAPQAFVEDVGPAPGA
jgi:lipopolysaccharide/colanic/teichoic acid biosynthesis glycosyltransferase/glycosyltransferase involved in cell wall biosynthesis